MAVNNFLSIAEKTLKVDIISTDTSFKLQDIKWYTGSDGVDVDLAAADFGTSTVGYGVFEPRTAKQEFFTWDTSTIANYATTGIDISARGLPWGSDYTTAATARKFDHPAGSKVLLYTNAPAFYNTFANKANAETITGAWTHSAAIAMGTNKITGLGTPTADTDACTKKYADDLAIAGAPDASTTVKGIVEEATGAELAAGTATGGTGARLFAPSAQCKNSSAGAGDANKIPVLDTNGVLSQTFLDSARTWGAVQSFTADNCQITSDADSANDAVRQSYLKAEISKGYTTGTAGETLVAGNAVYLKASDGKLWKADADANESTFSFAGIIVTGGAADATVYYARPGDIATGLSGLTAGTYYYISGTAGALSATPGARKAKVAFALSTTTARVIEPKFVQTGTVTLTAANTLYVEIGFYPTSLRLWGVTASGNYNGFSIGSDWNECFNVQDVSGEVALVGGRDYYVGDAGGATVGNVTKSATGMTLTTAAKGSTDSAYIRWEAANE